MQMYKVSFQVHCANVVNIGKAVVCAENAEAAQAIVIGFLDLPKALTQSEAVRLKPNFFLLERQEIQKPQAPVIVSLTPEQMLPSYRPSRKGLLAVAKQLAEQKEEARGPMPPLAMRYECQVLATVTAPDETAALLRLAQSLRDRGNAKPTQDPNVTRVSVAIEPHGVMREIAS